MFYTCFTDSGAGVEKLPKTTKREPTGGKREQKGAQGTSRGQVPKSDEKGRREPNPLFLGTIFDEMLSNIRSKRSSNKSHTKKMMLKGCGNEAKSMATLDLKTGNGKLHENHQKSYFRRLRAQTEATIKKYTKIQWT